MGVGRFCAGVKCFVAESLRVTFCNTNKAFFNEEQLARSFPCYKTLHSCTNRPTPRMNLLTNNDEISRIF